MLVLVMHGAQLMAGGLIIAMKSDEVHDTLSADKTLIHDKQI